MFIKPNQANQIAEQGWKKGEFDWESDGFLLSFCFWHA